MIASNGSIRSQAAIIFLLFIVIRASIDSQLVILPRSVNIVQLN